MELLRLEGGLSLKQALKKVSEEDGIAPGTLKRAYTEQLPEAQSFLESSFRTFMKWLDRRNEYKRRVAGLPDDVIAYLDKQPANGIDVLRRKGIDGDAPARFIEEVRKAIAEDAEQAPEP